MRSALVTSSIGIHIAVVAGLFVAGLWRLDRLDSPRERVDLAVATQPPPAASGSPSPAKAEPFKRKHRTVTREIVQPDRHETQEKATAAEPGTGGGGTGSGEGSGSGFDPTGTGTCEVPPCGDGPALPAPKPQPPAQPTVVSPTVIKGLRIAGETQIQPPATVKTTMLRDGASKVVASLRVCVGADGAVDNVSVLKSSGYAGYDGALVDGLGRWRYRAYEIGGRKVAVCGVVTFIYSIH